MRFRSPQNKFCKMKPSRAPFQLGGSLIHGRENDKKRIVKLVLSDDHDNHNGTFVCLVADDGAGKTTMLHLVYLDERVCRSFNKRIFICMPDHFDEMCLMQLIIESVTCASCDITNLCVLEELLKEELIGKKLLLVLDDFDSNNQKYWNILSMILNVCTKGSVVMVTTTREIVANIRGSIQYYYMNYLSDHWCWMILKQNAFFDNGVDPNPDLKKICKDLVAKCKNNTLCVKVLSGLLGYSITKEWWSAVLENDLWEMGEKRGDVLTMLMVSYELMPPHLKQCFKYCSLYPKNYHFSKQQLVLMWLSQGFIEPREGKEAETIGLEYFDELLSRSLFQHSPTDENKEDMFMMPKLIHDLSQCVATDQCFRFEGNVKKAPKSTCHLSIIPREFQCITLNEVAKETQHLKTIMVVTGSALQYENCTSQFRNLVNLADLFLKFGSLVILNLNNTDIEELPNSIGLLKSLRYLGLSGSKIKCIPPEICNLTYLETLDAKNCHYLEELPRSIQELINLRYLDVAKESGHIVMPSGMGKLTNLRTLASFNVGFQESHCVIEELKNLKSLKGSLCICCLENVRGMIDSTEVNLANKVHLEAISFNWSVIHTEGDASVQLSEEVLESLQPVYNLRELIIRNYPGNIFPPWISSFPNLESIILDNCYNCDNIPNLGNLPQLRYLSIHKMYDVQRMHLCNGYPSLELLNIWEMYGLEDWVEIADGSFPRLRTLTISRCPFLRIIPCFSSLVELSISYCTQLPEMRQLPSLEFLKIEAFQKTKSIKLPEDLVGLKKLEITHCFELLSLEGLPKLASLDVIECPKLDLQEVNIKRRHVTRQVQSANIDDGHSGRKYGRNYIHGSTFSRTMSKNSCQEERTHEGQMVSSPSSLHQSRSDVNYQDLLAPLYEYLSTLKKESPVADLSETVIYPLLMLFVLIVVMVKISPVVYELSRYQL